MGCPEGIEVGLADAAELIKLLNQQPDTHHKQLAEKLQRKLDDCLQPDVQGEPALPGQLRLF